MVESFWQLLLFVIEGEVRVSPVVFLNKESRKTGSWILGAAFQ